MLETAGPSVDSNVVREIWQNTIEKVVKSWPFMSSDMRGASDYILGVACRISLSVYLRRA